MNITLTDKEVRAAITEYLDRLHIAIPTNDPFVVEVDDAGLVSAKIEGAQLIFSSAPVKHAVAPPVEEEIEEDEDLSGFSGPDGGLGAAVSSAKGGWGLSTASTSLKALGKKNPADYMDEIGEPTPIGRY